jgi:hypothetical protein
MFVALGLYRGIMVCSGNLTSELNGCTKGMKIDLEKEGYRNTNQLYMVFFGASALTPVVPFRGRRGEK